MWHAYATDCEERKNIKLGYRIVQIVKRKGDKNQVLFLAYFILIKSPKLFDSYYFENNSVYHYSTKQINYFVITNLIFM